MNNDEKVDLEVKLEIESALPQQQQQQTLQIVNPRTLTAQVSVDEADENVSMENPSWHKPMIPDDDQGPIGEDVEEDDDLVANLRRELAAKDETIRKIVAVNASNVEKASMHINNLKKKFQAVATENGVLKSTISSKQYQLTNAMSLIKAQKETIDEMKKFQQDHQSGSPRDLEIFYPAVTTLKENGVFVLREMGKSSLCIRLPIDVSSEANKLEILDCELSLASKNKVGQRQAALTQAIELLCNPKNNQSFNHNRSQHLIFYVLSNTFTKYGFKNKYDKFLFRPNDSILFKPDKIIVNQLENGNLTPSLNSSPSSSKDWSKQIMVTKVQSLTSQTKRDDLEKKIQPEWEEEKKIQPKWEEKEKPLKSFVGPKSVTSLGRDAVLRDETMEFELLKAARWNSTKGRLLFNDGNKLLLNQVLHAKIPNVPEPKQNLSHVLVGFLAAEENGRKVFIPFLVIPKQSSLENCPPVRSNEITGFQLGQVLDNSSPSRVTCPWCEVSLLEPNLVRHISSAHGVKVKPTLNVKRLKNPSLHSPIPFSKMFWSFNVDPGAYSSFEKPDHKVPFQFFTMSRATPYARRNQIKRELENLECHLCGKKFQTWNGRASHLESSHSKQHTFVCPEKACSQICMSKLALKYHIKFQCVYDPEISKSRSLLNSAVILKDHLGDESASVDVTTVPNHLKPNRTENLAPKTEQDFSRRVIKKEPQDVSPTLTSYAIANGSKTTCLKRKSETAFSDSACEIVYDQRSKAKRRKKNPQVAFTGILKEIIINITNYLTTTKTILQKEKKVNFKRRLFLVREIEDRVDGNDFSTKKDFFEAFQSFCKGIADKNADDSTVVEVANDLVQFCQGELLIRKDELEALEKEINPVLSSDPLVVLNHILTKVLEEDVHHLRLSHDFRREALKRHCPELSQLAKGPWSLDDIIVKAKEGKYTNKREFLGDFGVIYKNLAQYFGNSATETTEAKKLLNHVKDALLKYKCEL